VCLILDRPAMVAEVASVSGTFPAEQARIVQILVERLDVRRRRGPAAAERARWAGARIGGQ
jgi:hypothetical protein